MNTIDLIVLLVLAVAVWNGWRKGFIVQTGSLVAIIGGLWLAVAYAAPVGEMLHFDPLVQTAGGFIVVLLSSLLVVAVAGRLLRRLCRFSGFGWLDTALGIAVSTFKYMLLVSVLFFAIDKINIGHWLIAEQTIEKSKSYKPVLGISELIFPLVEWAGDRMSQQENRPDDGA